MPRIGSKDYPRIMLAPLSGCSDLAFRLVAREHGARFCFFEMIDANSLNFGRRPRSLQFLKTLPEDVPIAAQVLGRDPDMMLNAARRILTETPKVSFLDVNAACPAKKVVKRKAGAHLLLEEKELAAIIKKLALNLPVPVTVKMRIGYDKNDALVISKIAMCCEKNGASALFVHARTKAQGYSGDCDYESLKAIKESVKIPVYGSGNIFSGADARKMLDETGCDGVLVARGSFGNPWIFDDIENHLKYRKTSAEIAIAVRKKILTRHLSYIEKHKDCKPSGKVGCMRKIFLWYTKGLPKVKPLRVKVSLVKSYDEMLELVDTL